MSNPKKHEPTLSRAEVETLCILHALGPSGCTAQALTARLGLHRSVTDAVEAAATQLLALSYIAQVELRFVRTAIGESRLRTRLHEPELASELMRS